MPAAWQSTKHWIMQVAYRLEKFGNSIKMLLVECSATTQPKLPGLSVALRNSPHVSQSHHDPIPSFAELNSIHRIIFIPGPVAKVPTPFDTDPMVFHFSLEVSWFAPGCAAGPALAAPAAPEFDSATGPSLCVCVRQGGVGSPLGHAAVLLEWLFHFSWVTTWTPWHEKITAL